MRIWTRLPIRPTRPMQLGLGVNVGHDLTLANLPAFVTAMPDFRRSLDRPRHHSDALEMGFPEAVRRYWRFFRTEGRCPSCRVASRAAQIDRGEGEVLGLGDIGRNHVREPDLRAFAPVEADCRLGRSGRPGSSSTKTKLGINPAASRESFSKVNRNLGCSS